MSHPDPIPARQTVHVDIDRTEMGDEWRPEVAMILRDLADRLESGSVSAGSAIYSRQRGEKIGRIYGNRAEGGAR